MLPLSPVLVTLSLAADAVPPLVLPPVPEIRSERFASDPPDARVGNVFRFDLLPPWLLGGIGAGRRFGEDARFGLAAELRFDAPIRLLGHGRTGWGVVPTIGVETIGAFPDHASAGLAIGLLESPSEHTSGSGLLVGGEALVPFRRDDGARVGGRVAATFLARGPYVALAYSFVPTDGPTTKALVLTFGLDLFGALR